MTSISEKIKTYIKEHETAIKRWFSDELYERLCRREEKELLVQIEKLLDFSELERKCEPYHKQNGMGRRVTHTVRRLVRILLVRYLKDYSLRETEQEVRYNLMSKWFVGYMVWDRGPDHSQIHDFEKWVIANCPRLYFDTVLRQIDQLYPDQKKKVQLGDTFALLANAQEEGITARLRHGCEVLLRVLKKEDVVEFIRLKEELSHSCIWQKQKGKHEWTRAERKTRRQQVGQEVLKLLERLEGKECGAKTMEWIAVLETILEQNFTIAEGESGREIVTCHTKPRKERGYLIGSVTDPEASIRNHGQGKRSFGYNVSVAATTDFVREIEARPGSEHDAKGLPSLIEKQQAYHDFYPPKLVYDQAAGTGKVAADVRQASQSHTQLVVDPVDYSQRRDQFGIDDFVLSYDLETATCPNGQVSQRRYRDSTNTGWTYVIGVTQCRDCPLRVQCLRNPDNDTKREVFLNDHYIDYLRLKAYTLTDSFAHEMGQRGHIERIIALLTRFQGARRARFRGQLKSDFQMKMCATAFNLKRWCLLSRPPPPGSPISQATHTGNLTIV